ncbi:MAG: hypothetical protein GC206_03660 [Alphaproteobacteria bacterium]|nr:hypothetical protein [Alphaproteobacteria bacterium]
MTVGIAAPGVAAAQDTVAERNAMRAEIPWYERFTYNHGTSEQTASFGQSERRAQAWTPGNRWGVTVDLNNAERSVTAPAPGDETAVGAYYQFTPSVRVGGQVSFGQRDPLSPARRDEEAEAGVRLESAFRF